MIKTIQKILFITLAFASFNLFAYCGVPPIPGGAKTDNKVYAGFKWTLNEGVKPEAVVGFRSARLNPSSYTNGGDISISAKFIDQFQLGKLRAKYFSGIDTAQAELSGGYDFAKGLFTGVSVNAPYVNAGVDYLVTGKKDSAIEAYGMVHTIGKYDKPSSIKCPSGTPNLIGGLCY